MGQFIYNSYLHVTIEDTVLAQLEAVVGVKFRANEPFYFSWNWLANTGEGRTTVWLHPSIAVRFHYLALHRPALDRSQAAEMLRQANTALGLSIVLDQIPPSSHQPRAA